MNNATTEPALSVIVSLVDHRDQALPCIKAFAANQTATPARYEILVVSDGTEPAMDELIRAHLRPQDRLVIEPAPNEYRLFNCGARLARGGVILITESHCLPESSYVETMLAAFDRAEMKAVRGATIGLASSDLERRERNMFEASFERALRMTRWNRVLIHGFAIQRDLFLRLNGFREKSENFAPWELGARLHREGVEIDYLPEARMHHQYMGDKNELRDFITRFCRSEWEYWASGDPPLIRTYFPPFPEWMEQGRSSRTAARSFFSAGRILPLLRQAGSVHPRKQVLSTIGHAWNRLFLDAETREIALRERTEDAWKQAEELNDADSFAAFWRACIDLGRWQGQRAHEKVHVMPMATGQTVAAADFEARALYGWMPVEKMHDGLEFRWLEPVAGLRIHLPGAARRLRVELAPVISASRQCRLFWGGRSFPVSRRENQLLEFILPEKPDLTDWLTLIVPAVQDQQPGRDLGLPLKSLTVTEL